MKPKTMILAVVAVLCGLVASYLTNQLLAQRSQQATEEPMVKVLVARQKIAAFAPIKEPEKLFAEVDYPERIAPKKALRDFDKVKDQRLNKPLDADKPITEDDLLTKDMSSLAGMMKPGERAIAIKVTAESLAGGFVFPGSRIDVICTMRGAETSSKVVLQDMLVLAVDTQHQRNADQPSILGQTVTVAAKPEEATRLALAASVGELRLSLRPLGDTQALGQVVTRVSDLDKPVATDSREERTETTEATRTPALPVTSLPALPPEEKKEEPAKVEPQPVERPVKRHKLTIHNGANKETTVFVLGQEDEDLLTTTDGARAKDAKDAKPEAHEPAKDKAADKVTEKPVDKPAEKPTDKKPAAPASTFGGRSTRTGKIQ